MRTVPPSPEMSSVLVTSVPMPPELPPAPPGRPVRGSVTPFSAGFSLIASGVSPCAICQAISPRVRSIALIRPHGGLTSGRPWTLSPPPPSSPAPPALM